MLTLEPGTIIHDRYRVLRPIGKGGMGAVYEAIDLRLHNTVAVKAMTAEGAEADRAFEQEAQLLASLRHAALPAVIDYFKVVAPDFTVNGSHDCLIEVPPEAYSKRLAFLMTPRRTGLCRVRVEVYATDALHLGTVPLEVDAVAAAITSPELRVAHLMLALVTRDGSLRAPALFDAEWDGATIEKLRLGGSAHGAIQIAEGSSMDKAFPQSRLQTPSLDQVHTGASVAPSAPRGRRRVPKWMAVGAPLVVLLAAVVVLRDSGPMSPVPPVSVVPGQPGQVATSEGPSVPHNPPTPSSSTQMPITQGEPATRAAAVRGVIPSEPVPVRRPTESETDYARRIRQVQQDYAFGKLLLTKGDYIGAVKIFDDLAVREPGWRDASTYLKKSQETLDEARQRALNEGLRLDRVGYDADNERRLAEAASAFIGASKAFERAAALQDPKAEKLLADNLERRHRLATAALARARMHANDRNWNEARKLFRLIIDVLPPGDNLRLQAESDLKRIGIGSQ